MKHIRELIDLYILKRKTKGSKPKKLNIETGRGRKGCYNTNGWQSLGWRPRTRRSEGKHTDVREDDQRTKYCLLVICKNNSAAACCLVEELTRSENSH